ncbi:hypothetical protein Tco_0315035, partial [Tanacetum coccineum]
ATLANDVKNCVVHSFVEIENENLREEVEKISKESKDVQENLLKRIVILKNDFRRCQAQSIIAFKLELQHQKEKNVCKKSWMLKVEKLYDENVYLAFQVKSLTKANEHLKLEYQKLFDSIKKTQTQTQREINELSENVNQNTYAYGDVRSKNQDLLITIYELKEKLTNLPS